MEQNSGWSPPSTLVSVPRCLSWGRRHQGERRIHAPRVRSVNPLTPEVMSGVASSCWRGNIVKREKSHKGSFVPHDALL